MPFGIGGSSSSSQSSSSQSVFQSDIFAQLFGNASNIAGTIDTAGLTEAANNLFSGGAGFLSDLQGISSGEDPAGQFLQSLISGEGGFVDENIAALGEDLGQFFDEELLPGITSEAVGGGQLGGGRQGVAEGKAIESVGREFRRGSIDIRNADLNRRTGAATALSQNQISAAGVGLGAAGEQFDLAQAATLAPFSPFLTLAQILGGPTTLSESQSSSKSKSLDLKFGGFGGGGGGGSGF